MTQIALNAGTQTGSFFAGMGFGYYVTEPAIHKLAVKMIASLSGSTETEIENDYNACRKQFALAKTSNEMTEAREAFERKHGKYTLTACNLASIAATTLSVISSAALAQLLAPSTGITLGKMSGIGITSILASLITVSPTRILAIRVLETLSGKELESDFKKYTKEILQEDKLLAAQKFKEKHGSSIFYAIRSSERIAAIVTTFAVSALAQYAFTR